jgi:predicted nucleic acid-binding protein
LPVTAFIVKRCGNLRGKFLQRGIVRTQADLLIAATAYEYNLTLATRNIPDFENCEVHLFNPFTLENPKTEKKKGGVFRE